MGSAWLTALPSVVEQCCARWEVAVEGTFPSSVAYVAWGRARGGSSVVLKIAPDRDSFRGEADVLGRWEGDGAPRLLKVDPDRCALLLERVEPGTSLEPHRLEPGAVDVGCELLSRLWSRGAPSAHTFPTTGQMAARVRTAIDQRGGGRDRLDEEVLEAASRLCDRLGGESVVDVPVLLHGDLHVGNILRSARCGWVAIDPQPVVGDPAADCGPLVRSLVGDEPTAAEISGLVERIAGQLRLDPERVRGWALLRHVQGSLTLPDGNDAVVARLLARWVH